MDVKLFILSSRARARAYSHWDPIPYRRERDILRGEHLSSFEIFDLYSESWEQRPVTGEGILIPISNFSSPENGKTYLI